jgi:hypothetical protein
VAMMHAPGAGARGSGRDPIGELLGPRDGLDFGTGKDEILIAIPENRKPPGRMERPSGYGTSIPGALLGLGCWFGQAFALVLDIHCDLGQRLSVLATVVGTKQQFPRVSEQHSDIRLGSATIA